MNLQQKSNYLKAIVGNHLVNLISKFPAEIGNQLIIPNFNNRVILPKILKLVFVALFLGISAQSIFARADLTGYYQSDDDGDYFVRQIGDRIYWFGEDRRQSRYANVLSGTLSGNRITARWFDVPKGEAQTSGEIVLEVTSNGDLKKISSTMPFGARVLKKSIPPAPQISENGSPFVRSRPQGFSDGGQTLTGVWTGNDGASYYVREIPGSNEIVWVAENNYWGGEGGEIMPAYVYVFFGKRVNQLVSGDWVEVPKGVAKNNGQVSFTVTNRQEIKLLGERVAYFSQLWRSLPNSLRGFADLHTHPMVNLGFGGKLVHGGVDTGSLLTADVNCNHNVRAGGIRQALGNDKSTHGGFEAITNPCGDTFRVAFFPFFQAANHAAITSPFSDGYPSFQQYPISNDITHQKMWVDWIRRSYSGGQRVLVALATHNSTLAAAVSGPGDGPPDDAASADLQLREMKDFVGRHADFMEVAYTAADGRRIVSGNRMAVVLGVEIDNIGNFNRTAANAPSDETVRKEIQRLYDEGVRYIFPVHVLDNAFGHTAVYEDLFNYSNKREEGNWWELQCAAPADNINYRFSPALGSDVPKPFKDLLNLLSNVKLSLDFNVPKPPDCTTGHTNKYGLNPAGRVALKEMMKLGMLIDIDHMSQFGANETLDIASAVPGIPIAGYPIVSGHTGLRGGAESSENSRTPAQLQRIARLGGMLGLGSAAALADQWASKYAQALTQMGDDAEGRVAFGTDLNGLVRGPQPRAGAEIYSRNFLPSRTGDKTWNYRTEGVAHYGMLPDFLKDLATVSNGNLVNSSLLKNAEMFARMWEKAERTSRNVR